MGTLIFPSRFWTMTRTTKPREARGIRIGNCNLKLVSRLLMQIVRPNCSNVASAARQNFAIVALSKSNSLATSLMIPHFKPVFVVGSRFADNRTKIECLCPVVNSLVLGAMPQEWASRICFLRPGRDSKIREFFWHLRIPHSFLTIHPWILKIYIERIVIESTLIPYATLFMAIFPDFYLFVGTICGNNFGPEGVGLMEKKGCVPGTLVKKFHRSSISP